MPITEIAVTKFSQRLLIPEVTHYKGFILSRWESGEYCIRPAEADTKELKLILRKAAKECDARIVFSHHFQNEVAEENRVLCMHIYTQDLSDVKTVIDTFWTMCQSAHG